MTDSTGTQQELTSLVGTWTLDASRTTVTFTTKAMWVLPVKATVTATEGSGVVASDGSVSGTLVLDAASVDTKNKKRDAHLRTEDFLEVSSFPTFVVTVVGATPTGPDAYDLAATLAVHGKERPLTLPASVVVDGGVATVTVETDIDRSGWGILWTKLGAGLQNHVVVTARFTQD